ncbi:RseA family anti-sigma factor [Lysobacter niabensis]|uniref:RseA family anti-sigma factor n=1 Tax=Agrilutibacter niabensis TaxID=380628 RepID=UPI0036109C3B
MTTGSTSNNHHALHPRDDRETLSALFDGELAADAMRFALKRLDHDAGWRNTCGRWVLIGDALRGEAAIAAAPSDFASGVMRVLASESHAAQAAPSVSAQADAALSAQGVSRRRWVGGAALAASVAMAAVLVVRPFSEPSSPGSGAQIAAGTVAPVTTQAAPSQTGQAVAPVSIAPASSTGGSSITVAVADAPQPTAARRSARSARALSRSARSAIAPPSSETAVVVASSEPATRHQPFHPPTDDIVTRPWPRAVLPGNANAGALTVDFGTGSASPSFYPFEPRLPSQDPVSAPQAPEPQP